MATATLCWECREYLNNVPSDLGTDEGRARAERQGQMKMLMREDCEADDSAD